MLGDSKTENRNAGRSAPASPMKRSKGSGDDAQPNLRDGMGKMKITGRGGDAVMASIGGAKDGSGKDGIRNRDLDRFVPSRPASLHHSSHSSTTLPTLALDSHTPDSSMDQSGADLTSSSISASLGLPERSQRILSFNAAPPPPSHATSYLDAQRNYLLHSSASSSRGTTTTGPGAAGVKKRTPPYNPDKVLDAPGFADDYYLNLMDWSCLNRVAIGLGATAYVWDAESGDVNALQSTSESTTDVTSVSWSNDGSYLAVGTDTGGVEIWDVDTGKRMRTMGGHLARVPSLSWHGHVLSSGCRDGSIYHHDVRIANHKVMELVGHSAEVCGLSWRADGLLLASGGNDNVVNCWDGRIGQSVLESGEGVPRGTAKWTKRNHTAAVKALAWCPWQSSLLATGGGTSDQTIHFWNTSTGMRTHSLPTKSQVTSLIWSPHSKEILSTHGFPDNNLCLWSFPTLQKIYDVPGHDARVLCSAISPDGCDVVTAAGDENLKFWKIWEAKSTSKAKSDDHRSGHAKQTAVRIR